MGASRLAGVALFSALTADEIERLETEMRFERHPPGTVLVEQGDLPTKFFVLVSGHVTVHRDGTHITDLGPGDFFGEMGVMALEARNAMVIATTPIEVAVMMGWRLRETMEGTPGLQEALERAVRLRQP